MSKNIIIGQKREVVRRAVGMCRITINDIVAKVYSKDHMIKELQAHTILQPLDSIVSWEDVLQKLVQEDRIRIILPEDLPLLAEIVCPGLIYLPLGSAKTSPVATKPLFDTTVPKPIKVFWATSPALAKLA